MERKVIVFGATGKTGALICRELEDNKIIYSVFVREQSSKKITNTSVEIKLGEVLNSGDVNSVFQNGDYTDVIISLGSKELKNSVIRSEGTRNILEAMNSNDSGATIHLVSALGIGDSWHQLRWVGKLMSNLLIKSAMDDHRKQEGYVEDSHYKSHVVRPVGLRDGAPKGTVHVQNKGYLPSNSIQRADVAKYLVDSILEDKTGISGICEVK